MSDQLNRSIELAVERTELALERTAMETDRTLMACGRTGLIQISFGLALFVFLEALKVATALWLSVVVMAIGTASALVGIGDYIATNKRLQREYGRRNAPPRYRVVLVAMIAMFGLVMLVTVLIRKLT
jgi:uncharacterized membrane protein YidH (DUF202 family)